MRDETKIGLICYLVIGLFVGVWLLAGGWKFALMLFLAAVHG